MRTNVIAHRGASADRPENTVDAFAEARNQGADWVELDVRLSADQFPMVLHDAHLPDGRAVADTARGALPGSLPTLGAALEACAGMGVNIEIKHHHHEPGFTEDRHIAQVVSDAISGSTMELLISSFDLATIDAMRHRAPQWPTAYLVMDASPDVVAACVERGHRFLHPWDQIVDEALMQRCHDAGIGVNVWTVDDPDRMRQLADWGVSGIVTNRPGFCRNVLLGDR